jgi:hypothetical protein
MQILIVCGDITFTITWFLDFVHHWYSEEHSILESGSVSKTLCSLEYRTESKKPNNPE